MNENIRLSQISTSDYTSITTMSDYPDITNAKFETKYVRDVAFNNICGIINIILLIIMLLSGIMIYIILYEQWSYAVMVNTICVSVFWLKTHTEVRVAQNISSYFYTLVIMDILITTLIYITGVMLPFMEDNIFYYNTIQMAVCATHMVPVAIGMYHSRDPNLILLIGSLVNGIISYSAITLIYLDYKFEMLFLISVVPYTMISYIIIRKVIIYCRELNSIVNTNF